jgi:glycosyl transferase family 2
VIPTWTILIATLGQRYLHLDSMLSNLLPQVEEARGEVTVEALWNNGERSLHEVRNDLVDHATAEYLTFVDDDDILPGNYVSTLLPLLDGVDYVGFRVQAIFDGITMNPTFHSLRYDSWWEDGNGYYRDISYVNPFRRDIAVANARFRPWGATAEDYDWVTQMRGHLKTEHYVDEVMYIYTPRSWDCTWRGVTVPPPGTYRRPEIDCPYFSWHPASSE